LCAAGFTEDYRPGAVGRSGAGPRAYTGAGFNITPPVMSHCSTATRYQLECFPLSASSVALLYRRATIPLRRTTPMRAPPPSPTSNAGTIPSLSPGGSPPSSPKKTRRYPRVPPARSGLNRPETPAPAYGAHLLWRNGSRLNRASRSSRPSAPWRLAPIPATTPGRT
jgi:hypothetical protein